MTDYTELPKSIHGLQAGHILPFLDEYKPRTHNTLSVIQKLLAMGKDDLTKEPHFEHMACTLVECHIINDIKKIRQDLFKVDNLPWITDAHDYTTSQIHAALSRYGKRKPKTDLDRLSECT